ncbi:MAG: ribbon-helix-helix domain-containing protein [Anaerolineae bacterium]
MDSKVSITLDFETKDKIDTYVKRGRFNSAQELVETAIRQFLYELRLDDTEWPRRTGIYEREIVDELGEIRRVQQSRPGDDPGLQR